MSTEVAQPSFCLDRETALKIALAAREMPEISAASLIEVLQSKLGNQITSDTLKHITVTDLKTGFASADGEEDGEDIGIGLPQMKNAVRILWGVANIEQLPPLEAPLSPLDQSMIRVAVASNEAENLDGHFGSCIHFLVYELSIGELRLVDIRSTLDADLSEDKNFARAQLISDCDVLYVQSIGGPAAAKVVRAGIYPIKVKEDVLSARLMLVKLQQVMQDNPPPWLAKIMGISAEQRVRFMRTEDDSD
jgi:nitrogen fixation protein NifX